MSRALLIGIFSFFILNTSCERCMTCSYSYTETTIVQTVNGEEEEVSNYEGRYILDEEGASWSQECIKERDAEEFSIANAYEEEKQTTDQDNFDYTCVEQ